MVKEQSFRIFYIGKDPFTAKLIEALLAKKGLEICIAKDEKKLFVKTKASDLILMDQPDQITKRTDINQVLLAYQPTSNRYMKFWCKTPINEVYLNNLLFYIRKKEFFIDGKADQFTFSTKKLDGFLGDDESGKKEIIAEFLTNLNTNYRMLEEFAKSNDIQGVRSIAHKMISGSGYYEVNELNQKLRLLESERVVYTLPQLHIILTDVYQQVILLRSALVRRFF